MLNPTPLLILTIIKYEKCIAVEYALGDNEKIIFAQPKLMKLRRNLLAQATICFTGQLIKQTTKLDKKNKNMIIMHKKIDPKIKICSEKMNGNNLNL